VNDRLQFLSLVLGFALWAALGILKFVPLDPLIALLQMGLGGLITHMLKGGPAAPSAPPAPSAQGGFSSPALLVLLAVGAMALTGCAGFGAFQQALVGYEGAAYSGLKQINDNKLNVTTAALCEGTSVGAAIRNPQSIALLKAACTNGSNDPNSLFDGKQQPITINLTVPAVSPAVPASGAAKP
jgi:hypothetical protein